MCLSNIAVDQMFVNIISRKLEVNRVVTLIKLRLKLVTTHLFLIMLDLTPLPSSSFLRQMQKKLDKQSLFLIK
jgi:hypothetical protein